MKKDIDIPVARNVFVVAVREWDEAFTAQNWNVYLINDRQDTIEAVLVVSRGKSEDQKTSVLRHGLGAIESGKAVKVELITEQVLGFTNEYLVTFFAEGKLFERNFTFEAFSISEDHSKQIPQLDTEGVFAS